MHPELLRLHHLLLSGSVFASSTLCNRCHQLFDHIEGEHRPVSTARSLCCSTFSDSIACATAASAGAPCCTRCSDRHQPKQGRQRLCRSGGASLGWSNLFHPQMHGTPVLHARNERGVLRQRQLKPHHRDAPALGERQANVPDPHALDNNGTSLYRAESSEDPENGEAAERNRSSMEWICSSVGMFDAATVSYPSSVTRSCLPPPSAASPTGMV